MSTISPTAWRGGRMHALRGLLHSRLTEGEKKRCCCSVLCSTIHPAHSGWRADCFLPFFFFFSTPLIFPTSFPPLAQFKNLLQSHPCWRIFSVVEPTIWHLGDSPKYEWPIHEAQWSCLAMALLPLPPPYSKQYSAQQSWHFSPKSTKEELEAVPETLKALSLCEMQVLGTSKAI